VQTRAFTSRPPIITLPDCRLGRKRRLVRLLEWLTLCPYCGPLPQISHLLAMVDSLSDGREPRLAGGSGDAGLYHSSLR
jgi:hypothetical protein